MFVYSCLTYTFLIDNNANECRKMENKCLCVSCNQSHTDVIDLTVTEIELDFFEIAR